MWMITERSPFFIVSNYGLDWDGMGWGGCRPPCAPNGHQLQALIPPLCTKWTPICKRGYPPCAPNGHPSASVDTPLVHQMDTHLQALIPPLCAKRAPIYKSQCPKYTRHANHP